ncbi:uncharacterized protein GBIM_12046, partial [Gryllus bimaculatus]
GCVYVLCSSAETYTVRVGSTESGNGGTVLEVKKFIVHPKYDPEIFFDYDIALVELKKSIEISPTSQTVELPEEGRPVEVGEVGVVAGWGRLKGDSGGPFVINDTQIGIVSFGLECGKAGTPGVYSNVPVLRSWISKKAGV